MKKFVVFSLIALLVLAFGSMAFAQAKKEEPKLEFKVSGFIDAVSLYWQNVSAAAGPLYGPPGATYLPAFAGLGVTTGTQFDKKNAGMTTRGHLRFDVNYGKEMSGTIFFEMDSTRWGDTSRSEVSRRGETLGRWGGDETAVEIKNLFFTFGVPGVPVPMQATLGLQPLSIRPKVFVYTDGTGVQLSTRVDPATISLLWFKALEGKDAAADDVDVYGIHASAKVATFTLGGYGVYYNMNTYPVTTSTILTPSVAPSFDSEMWWLGLYADGKAGPVVLNFDFAYSLGEVEWRSGYRVAGRKDSVDYGGWIGRLRLDYPWEKFNFGAIGLYATGSDLKKTDANGLPGRTVGFGAPFGFSRKVGGYVVPPFSENFAFGDSIVITTEWNRAMSGFRTANGTQLHRGAFGGTAMAQAYASFKATPWYKVTLKGMYLWDTTKNGNTIGNARTIAGRPRDDNDIGWELDLINEINIYKQLKWDIAGGVLFAGDALDYNVTAGGAATPFNKGPKNPYIILTRLVYSF